MLVPNLITDALNSVTKIGDTLVKSDSIPSFNGWNLHTLSVSIDINIPTQVNFNFYLNYNIIN